MKTGNKQIDYIYICQKWGKWNRVTTLRETVAGISVLRLTVTEKKKRCRLSGASQELPERFWKKLKKIIKQYQTEHCVVGADFNMAEKLQMEDVLFFARKQELLEHRREVFGKKKQEITTDFLRRSFLLVLDSERWSEQDILQLLLTAKDCYNDLNIVIKNNHINISKLATILYDEWGIVLHVLPEKTAKKSQMDYVLFLLGKWESNVYRYSVKRGYVVCENEKGLVRTRGRGELSSGFVYECDGVELPYQMAVDIFYQNPELYDNFAITFIDISSL